MRVPQSQLYCLACRTTCGAGALVCNLGSHRQQLRTDVEQHQALRQLCKLDYELLLLSPLLPLLTMLSTQLICKTWNTVRRMHRQRQGEGADESMAVVLNQDGMHLRAKGLTVYGPQAIAAVPATARLVCKSIALVVCCPLRTCQRGAAMCALKRTPACLLD